MMFYESKDRTDKSHDKKHKQNYCKRYYMRGNKHRMSTVATKSSSKHFVLPSKRANKPKIRDYYAFVTLNDIKDNKC